MKFKALRTIREPKEFVIIETVNKMMILYTSALPNPQPLTATLEGMKEYYKNDIPLADTLTLDDLEMVEFEMYEVRDSSTVGADIRNKLTPSLNLLSLLKIYFGDTGDRLFDDHTKTKILPHIKKEMVKCEENIKYISNLLE
jgi:hypothetical protein